MICGIEDERDRTILLMRAEGLTLREVADTMGLTKERVRQLQSRGIRAMKAQAGTATSAEKDLYAKHQRGLARQNKISEMKTARNGVMVS